MFPFAGAQNRVRWKRRRLLECVDNTHTRKEYGSADWKELVHSNRATIRFMSEGKIYFSLLLGDVTPWVGKLNVMTCTTSEFGFAFICIHLDSFVLQTVVSSRQNQNDYDKVSVSRQKQTFEMRTAARHLNNCLYYNLLCGFEKCNLDF